MNLFTNLLNSPLRWVLAGLALIGAVMVGAQGLDYASTWWGRHRLAEQVQATDASRTARRAPAAARSASFDSTFWVRAARARQYAHENHLKKLRDDSLAKTLPAVPVLPARPPRY